MRARIQPRPQELPFNPFDRDFRRRNVIASIMRRRPGASEVDNRVVFGGSRAALWRRLDEPLRIARHLVDFDVDEVAGLARPPGGDGERVRDEKDLEIFTVDGVDRE